MLKNETFINFLILLIYKLRDKIETAAVLIIRILLYNFYHYLMLFLTKALILDHNALGFKFFFLHLLDYGQG